MKNFETATVADVMHEGVVTCDVDEPLTSVARTLVHRRIHCVVVWHDRTRSGDAELWGVISDLDLVKVAATEDIADRTAGGSAASPALLVAPGESLRRAAQLMAENDVTHLVVVDPDTASPVGVLSTLDVARGLVGSSELAPAV